jgi:hypothetical protein
MYEDDFLEMQYEDRFLVEDDLDSDSEYFCNWCGKVEDDCECDQDG